MQQTSIIVDVSYPYSDKLVRQFIDDAITSIAINCWGKFFSSGYGYNSQNLAFEFPDNECAERFRKHCRDKGLKVWN